MPPPITISDADKLGFEAAFAQAQRSFDEGGVPIGAALVVHDVAEAGAGGEREGSGPRVIGQGHNERIQKSSAILHGEISALDDAGRQRPSVYRNATMVSPELPGAFSMNLAADSRNWGARHWWNACSTRR